MKFSELYAIKNDVLFIKPLEMTVLVGKAPGAAY